MGILRNHALRERIRLLYENTHAPALIRSNSGSELPDSLTQWLQEVEEQTHTIAQQTSAGLYPPPSDQIDRLHATNRHLRDLHERHVAPYSGRRFENELHPNDAEDWHKTYQLSSGRAQ